MIARFLEAYGHDLYYSERWGTRDRIIPFKHFFLLLNALGNVNAAHQLQAVFATGHGYALAQSGKDAKVRTQTRNLIRAANPEVL